MTDRILLIEDDKRLAEMVKNYLGEFGFCVTAAHSGGAGISPRAGKVPGFAALSASMVYPHYGAIAVPPENALYPINPRAFRAQAA